MLLYSLTEADVLYLAKTPDALIHYIASKRPALYRTNDGAPHLV
jgi:hypothetical protein